METLIDASGVETFLELLPLLLQQAGLVGKHVKGRTRPTRRLSRPTSYQHKHSPANAHKTGTTGAVGVTFSIG